ncbi:MAG: hypothetical protein WDO06_00370 [Actinomycetota bacterium]
MVKAILIPIDELQVGEEFLVKPGQRIATDGVVVSGESAVDNSLLTGESRPVEVSVGSAVIGSSLNRNGQLVVKATRVGSDTELARITSMVVTAQGTKAPIQRPGRPESVQFLYLLLCGDCHWRLFISSLQREALSLNPFHARLPFS